MQDISAFIITYNEEIHIARAIENAKKYATEIFVLDSFSTDRTIEIAKSFGVKVYQHEFKYHADQLNWGLDNLPFATEWIWRQDADEYLTDELIAEIDNILPNIPKDVNAFTAPCLRKFLGKYIKHGIVPLNLLRLFRRGHARWEDKKMDEHIYITDGNIRALKNAFFDDNLNNISWWTNKHNRYASKEAIDLLMTEYSLYKNCIVNSGIHSISIRKKKLKYIKLPLFWRAFALFVLRYFFRLGFLDGKEGFLWHFLQGWWYRTLADAKVFEIKKRFDWDEEKIKEYLINNFLTKVNRGG